MRITHVLHVFRKGFCKFTIRIESIIIPARMSLPGTRMNFIDCHGTLVVGAILLGTILHPLVICPVILITNSKS